ncbi:ATP-binding protein [Clostridium sardiniense]|uniref:ATP-binding protein n=1 Tax=Clostridium sardiniense TaxID=29369 RepID=UPI001959F4E8|nr:signal transduction histidine kinase [Clostridium sardiniense]
MYIVKNASIDGSSTINIFKKTLVMNSLIVSAIVIFLAIIISLYISKKTVDDLKKTEELAQNINLGNDTNIKLSSIKEIRFIQVSLQELSSKLKLKQKGRKKLLDEMIHQTRTPLTILKSHVEAYEDGILELNSSECNILEDQIDNVTSIISNMSEMIEGEKDLEDTGIGIKKEDLKRIFEAYYRGVNTNKIKGEGIGLYVAYENIEAIKGKIEVESKYGIGTKFIIMLPYT